MQFAGESQLLSRFVSEEQAHGQTSKRSPGAFTRELFPMMYGFGDVSQPSYDTVRFVERLSVEYVSLLLDRAAETRKGTCTRVQTEDLVSDLRKDMHKQARVKQLLVMNEELKAAKKSFDLQEAQSA
mmetsp:Transcript_10710/g.37184  ORF Transcript_10710/g.37184 Transcript_10710/m.37184 type:complete len:127 (+) Transcript_10710:311-691(+)